MSDTSSSPPLATSLWANRKCLAICCLISMANLEFGMDNGVVGSLQAVPGWLMVFGYPSKFIPGGFGLDSTFQQLITSLPILGALISSLVSGVFSAYLGRRYGLWLACIFTAIGVAIQMNPTDNRGAIYVGRIVLGLGNGFLQVFSNIYCAEVAPAHLRGVMVALSTEWVLIGSIISAVIMNETSTRLDKSSYQLPLGILLILPVILAVGLFFVPESPRYLIVGGKIDEARRSLEAIRGDSVPGDEIEVEYVEMVKGIEEEKRLAATVGPMDMWRGTDLRRTLLCIGVSVADSGGSGAWFLIPYAIYFMAISGVPSADIFHYFIINTCIGLVVCNLGMYLMRHVCGRRTLLLLGSVSNTAWLLGLAVSDSVETSFKTSQTLLITFISLFLIGYSFLTGVVTRPVATEVVSTRLRAYSFGLTQAISSLIMWLVSFCTPYFINPEKMHWGGKYAYIFVGSNVICFVWYYFFIPETKGRSLEEIDELFEKKVATNDFKTFATRIRDDALRDIKSGHVGVHVSGNKESPAVKVHESSDHASAAELPSA